MSVAIAGGAANAWAAPPRLPVQRPTGMDTMPSVKDAETIVAAVKLVDARARASYDAGEYSAAAEQWESAHTLLGMEVGLDVERQELAFHLAHAHIHANSADNDPQRLERARTLLWGYVAHLQRPDHTPTAEERERIDRSGELIEIVEYRLRDARVRAMGEHPMPPDGRELPRRRAAVAPHDETRPRGMIGGGATGMVIGVVSIAIGGALVKGRADQGGVAALGIGGALFTAGAVVLGIGLAELRRVRVRPTLARSSAGLAFSGRF
ncbi:MAG TPA: hypothetical protein VG755_40920 [Nannocystaceae bacterium]|nr:hypothetical protein [Nannocystaceae bacterium]